jgi:hypothetical protein
MIRVRAIGVAVALGTLLLGSSTPAVAATATPAASLSQIGDWSISVGPVQDMSTCTGVDPSWCGDAVFLRSEAPYAFDDWSDVSVNGTLTGSSGSIPFEYGSMSVLFDGSNEYDNSYWGQFASWSSATNSAWPSGNYTFSVTESFPGKWECSQYDPNGCTWNPAWNWSHTYSFSFNGSDETIAATTPSLRANTKPVIEGTAKVGKKLSTKAATWQTTPSKLTYQWLRGGKKISGATHSTYKLVKADGGHKVAVKVTGSRSGYGSASTTSASVTVKK